MARKGTVSELRLEARAVIASVLQAMPDADLKAKRQALKAAYPFHPRCRRGNYAWHAEVSPYLRASKPAPVWPGKVVFRLDNPTTRPWLRVDCSWCGNRTQIVDMPPGDHHCTERRTVPCLMCGAAYRRVAAVVALPTWQALQEAARAGDVTAGMALKDWIRDQGIEFGEVSP